MQRDNLPKKFPRTHYNKHGKSKKGYDNELEAQEAINKFKLKFTYKAYKCRWCNKYHIGKI